MNQSVKEFVKQNNTDMKTADELIALLGVDTVSQLPPKVIKSISKIKKDIKDDLEELTLNESVEYLTLLLISYIAKMNLRIKELYKDEK